VTTALQNPPAAPPNGQQAQAPLPPWAFPVGVLAIENPDYDQTKTQSAAIQQFPNYTLEPTGWLRGLWVQVEMTITGQATNSVTYSKDNPFSVVQKFTFKDTGNREVFGPLNGYDWMVINKFGGYDGVGDPRADQTFLATTGTGSTAGTFSFLLYMPLELVARDGLGATENKSDNSAWKAELFMNTQAATYNQVPSVFGSLRIRITEDGYTEPEQAAPSGRPFSTTPPLPGTLQYWSSENMVLPAGTASYNVVNGISYPLRMMMFEAYDVSAGTRAGGDTAWPDPFTLTYGKVQLFQRYKLLWISKMSRAYGLTGALGAAPTVDSALQREAGVFPVWFNRDFTNTPGAELRNGYLNTKTGTVLKGKGAFGASVTLFTLVNYAIAPGNNYYALLGGR
jgi:hypothetical protein